MDERHRIGRIEDAVAVPTEERGEIRPEAQRSGLAVTAPVGFPVVAEVKETGAVGIRARYGCELSALMAIRERRQIHAGLCAEQMPRLVVRLDLQHPVLSGLRVPFVVH